jgi:hypothetical protein
MSGFLSKFKFGKKKEEKEDAKTTPSNANQAASASSEIAEEEEPQPISIGKDISLKTVLPILEAHISEVMKISTSPIPPGKSPAIVETENSATNHPISKKKQKKDQKKANNLTLNEPLRKIKMNFKTESVENLIFSCEQPASSLLLRQLTLVFLNSSTKITTIPHIKEFILHNIVEVMTN